ncbi:MAG: GNAT family N-acetyltransferase [Treponema sp.]|nr:GNAT family N-acetyltransferase [Treponema sp.]
MSGQIELKQLNRHSSLKEKALAFLSPHENVCCRLYAMTEQNPQDIFCLIDSGYTIQGVLSYTKGQLVLPCLPIESQEIKDALQVFFYNHPVFCLSGKVEFCRIAREAIIKTATQVPGEERLYDFFECREAPEYTDIPQVTFFHCTKKDAESMIGLQLEYIKEEVLPKDMELNPASERLNLDRHIKEGNVWALKDPDGKICAKAQINASSPHYQLIGGVCTDRAMRRKGYASLLMYHLVKNALLSHKASVLFADRKNSAAQVLYRSLGFKEISGYSISYFKK